MVWFDCAAPVDIDGYANRFTRFRRAAFRQGRTMNKNITAFLRIGNTQLSQFGPIMAWHIEQSMIANLSAHFGVTGCPIENDIELARRSRITKDFR